QDEMKSRRHLGCPGYPAEVGFGPRRAEPKRVRRFSVEVSHVGGKRVVAPVKGAWQRCTKDSEILLWRINLHRRIDFQKVIEPARLIAMAMRDDRKVELLQVDTRGFDIVREDLRIIAGVEQNPLAAILDEGRKSPVLCQRRSLAEGVVQNRDLRGV